MAARAVFVSLFSSKTADLRLFGRKQLPCSAPFQGVGNFPHKFHLYLIFKISCKAFDLVFIFFDRSYITTSLNTARGRKIFSRNFLKIVDDVTQCSSHESRLKYHFNLDLPTPNFQSLIFLPVSSSKMFSIRVKFEPFKLEHFEFKHLRPKNQS